MFPFFIKNLRDICFEAKTFLCLGEHQTVQLCLLHKSSVFFCFSSTSDPVGKCQQQITIFYDSFCTRSWNSYGVRWITWVDGFLSFTWDNLSASFRGSPQGQLQWQRFIPFLDDLLDSFDWLCVKQAGRERVSMVILATHLSVLPSSFNCFNFNHIWQDTMMLCLTKIHTPTSIMKIGIRERTI